MTQSKKKKRANRSLLLAKKIIIKDGGTVSFHLNDSICHRIS
jgi:hypothetical protein